MRLAMSASWNAWGRSSIFRGLLPRRRDSWLRGLIISLIGLTALHKTVSPIFMTIFARRSLHLLGGLSGGRAVRGTGRCRNQRPTELSGANAGPDFEARLS